ncbi:ankyrin [Coniochaeta sp. PMI_546]|nr:ankyrin [Coniochaeta sp. PMI_546]
MSTLVHSSLLGLERIPLASAILQAPSDVNRLDDIGWSPMHWAIWRKDGHALKMMLACPESNPNVRDGDGETLLHLAARHERSGSTEMARLLLDAGADVNASKYLGYRQGITPIIGAFHNPAMVQLLLDRGARVTVECLSELGRYSLTPLLTFSEITYNERLGIFHRPHDWARSLELLLSAGVDLDLPSKGGMTALHCCIFNRNEALTRLLLRHGASVAAVDDTGYGILHYAAYFANLELINILREAEILGVDPDALDDYGRSPMEIMRWRMLKFSDSNPLPGETVLISDVFIAFEELLEEIRSRNVDEESAIPSSFEQRNEVASNDGVDMRSASAMSNRSYESDLDFGDSEVSFRDLLSDSEDLVQHSPSGSGDDYETCEGETSEGVTSEGETSEDEFFDATEQLGTSSSSG